MAQIYQCVRLGDTGRVDHTPAGAIAAGEVVVIAGMLCFATQPIAALALGTLETAGGPPKIRIVKAAGGIAVGNAVYWHAAGDPQGGTLGTGAADTVSAGGVFVGRCIVIAGATDEYVDCQMTIGVVTNGGLENAIADPGNSVKVIPVNASGHCALVSTGADTRTLGAPTFAGQQLLLYHKTDGGSCVVTCATTVNETGNNTITFTNAGDSILLHGVYDGTNLRWRCPVADGAALSTA